MSLLCPTRARSSGETRSMGVIGGRPNGLAERPYAQLIARFQPPRAVIPKLRAGVRIPSSAPLKGPGRRPGPFVCTGTSGYRVALPPLGGRKEWRSPEAPIRVCSSAIHCAERAQVPSRSAVEGLVMLRLMIPYAGGSARVLACRTCLPSPFVNCRVSLRTVGLEAAVVEEAGVGSLVSRGDQRAASAILS
jgi:hypothetical protein